MAEVIELAEAHLLNVQREIQTLTQKQAEIGNEIERMKAFLNEGLKVVEDYKQPMAVTGVLNAN